MNLEEFDKVIQVLWDTMKYIQNENNDYKQKIENAIDLLENELGHLKCKDEETWNDEFYVDGKLDYRKLCITILENAMNILKKE